MPLMLTMTSVRTGARPEVRTLTQGTMSIGRGPDNDWVLADEDRQLSKTHCVIAVQGGRYVLTDLSTNGVFINGAREPTQRDSQSFLSDGDYFRLGEYQVMVSETLHAQPPAQPGFGTTPPAGLGQNGFAGGAGFGQPGRADPFGGDALDDPFGGPGTVLRHPIQAAQMPQRRDDPFDRAGGAGGGFGAAPVAGFGGSTAGSFGGSAAGGFGSGFGGGARGADAFGGGDDDLFNGVTPAEQWRGPSQPDNADAPNQVFRPPAPLPTPAFGDTDFDALLGDEPLGFMPGAAPQAAPVPAPAKSPPAAPRPVFDDATFAPSPAFAPPAPAAAPPPAFSAPPAPPPAFTAPPAPASAPPPPVAGTGADALYAAFLAGAGVPQLRSNQPPEEMMRAAGQVFRALTEGLRETLMTRAAVKNGMRVEQTMLRARDNNALKFSITVDEAVSALLCPDRAGYKPPLAATAEAFRDVQSHEMAVMAGVQAALTSLLRRFDPEALETRLQPGRLDSLLPGQRKARIWELFCTTYRELAREAEDDFQTVFGREFARAYEAQMKKL